jgi:SAM-dependent methyltransferase
MSDGLAPRDSFEAVADLYARVRPGYPAALFDDLAAIAGLGPDSAVLEVGCGAGQATGDLAARAGRLVALDPGEKLVGAAQRRVSAATKAEFVVARFEDYAPPPGGFDLVASAQAWHWVDPVLAFQKAADALAEGGWLAIFGHVPSPPPEPFATPFRAAFERHAPGAWDMPPPQAWYRTSGPIAQLIAGSGLFAPPSHRAYHWTWRQDAQALGAYLRTDSSYHFLPEPERFALFDELARAVEDLGEPLPAPWETHLYVARKL